jgi:hypothetical protein
MGVKDTVKMNLIEIGRGDLKWFGIGPSEGLM